MPEVLTRGAGVQRQGDESHASAFDGEDAMVGWGAGRGSLRSMRQAGHHDPPLLTAPTPQKEGWRDAAMIDAAASK